MLLALLSGVAGLTEFELAADFNEDAAGVLALALVIQKLLEVRIVGQGRRGLCLLAIQKHFKSSCWAYYLYSSILSMLIYYKDSFDKLRFFQ